jgi:hypothetical protein
MIEFQSRSASIDKLLPMAILLLPPRNLRLKANG